MKKYNVNFLPEETIIEIEEGTTILEAAQKASVNINCLCGGNGVCGKCRVQVKDNKIRAGKSEISFLSKEEIEAGYALACQAVISRDLEVVIPPESRLDSEQILMEDVAMDFSQPEIHTVPKLASDPLSLFDPLARKLYLKLDEPTAEDNVSDVERIIVELKKQTDFRYFEPALSALQTMGQVIREADWKVTATIIKYDNIWKIAMIEAGDTSRESYGTAIDIGTTTIVAQLINMKTGKVIGISGSHNPQAGYGADVISRMIYACNRDNGLNQLHGAVVKTVNSLIKNLTDKNNIRPDQVTTVMTAGNTTMTHLLLAMSPCNIRMSPYVPAASIFPPVLAKDLGVAVHPEGVLHAIPCIASYVGGDIVAGIIACGISDKPEMNLLIDVGTNGEIALGNNEYLVCCSASAGPAFEGGGIQNGMRATRGAIERVSIEDGELEYQTIDNAKPRGICGSGLIDCIYEFARSGIINKDGKFDQARRNRRLIEKDGKPEFIVAYAEDTETGADLTISEPDISNIIRSKGAVFAAIKSLLDYIGVRPEEIDTFYVAGGFGTYLNIPKAIGIGLLPDIDPARIKFIGNSSLIGARMALLSEYASDRARKIANSATNIELSTYQPFMDEYIAAMFLPHTDRNLFPSVNY
ncbi:MAG: DUF4445 domain-containing protein [Deltaproteobacteria bacterium]|nr:DUF4445 domain-containing protein [Deltaproteobacteria bacterium]